jgi:uncharacterized surface protein with fasciclin (FAS1) repeats
MKRALLATMGILCGMVVLPARADNPNIERALMNRPEISTFYQALVNTGVIHELQPDRPYTVFAPVNSAFAKYPVNEYPCFYSSACRAEVAQILRNHIVPGETYLSDAVKQKGGIYSVNNRFVSIAEPYKNNYSVDGKNVLKTAWVAPGIVYETDGVIASEREMAAFTPLRYFAQGETVTTTTTRRNVPVAVIPPACSRVGECPGTVTQETTTVIRSPEPQPMISFGPDRY